MRFFLLTYITFLKSRVKMSKPNLLSPDEGLPAALVIPSIVTLINWLHFIVQDTGGTQPKRKHFKAYLFNINNNLSRQQY